MIKALQDDNSSPICSGCDEDDDYEAYSSGLLEIVMEVAVHSRSHFEVSEAYTALVNGAWNPDSTLERWLAQRPESIKPALKRLLEPDRGNAVYLLADLLRNKWSEMCKTAPDAGWEKLHDEQVLTMLRTKALHEDGGVRCDALLGLSLVGSEADRELLTEIGRDPSIKYCVDIALKQIDDGKTTKMCSLPATPTPKRH